MLNWARLMTGIIKNISGIIRKLIKGALRDIEPFNELVTGRRE